MNVIRKGEQKRIAIPDPKWCAWISGVHLVVSILQMRDPLGPRGILPDYTNVKLPPFPKNLMWEKDIQSNQRVKGEWNDLKDSEEIIDNYTGVPYEKVAGETAPIVRDRWPRLPENAIQLVEEILEEMRAGDPDRPWADGYNDGIVKATYRRSKVKEEEESDAEAVHHSRVPPR